MPDNDNSVIPVEEMDVSQLASHCADKLSMLNRWLSGKTILGNKRFFYMSEIDSLGVALARLRSMALELQASVDAMSKNVTIETVTTFTETTVDSAEPTVTVSTVTVETEQVEVEPTV